MHPPDAESERVRAQKGRLLESRSAVEKTLERAERKSGLFGFARVLVFFLILASLMAAWLTEKTEAPIRFAGIGVVAFFAVVLAHLPVIREAERLTRLARLLAMKLGRFDDSAPTPIEALVRLPIDPPAEPSFRLPPEVIDDLAVTVGARHLHAFHDAAVTPLGRTRLAQWFEAPLRDAAAIRARQAAVRTLVAAGPGRHGLEQGLATVASVPWRTIIDDLRAADPAVTFPRVLPAIFGAAVLGLVIGGIAIGSSWMLGAATLIVASGGALWRREIRAAVEERIAAVRAETAWRAMLRLAHDLTPLAKDARLTEILARWTRLTANGAVGTHLRQTSALKIYRLGLLYVAWNFLTFYDLWTIAPVAAFRRARRKDLLDAVEAIADLDALNAFAITLETKHEMILPEIDDAARPRFEADGIAHPLVRYDAVTPNDVRLGETTRLLVVTGSNMAGKSTYLKSVGLLAIAAQAGAPVRARRARVTPVSLLTDINVRDALDSGESYFAVEAGRVKRILDLADRTPLALALLDEIFRGTNTREKVAAGIETAVHLAKSGALAILATHDHEFTFLANEVPGGVVRNAHFTENVANGVMTFDYVMRPGAAEGGNALLVLESKGYPESLIRNARRRAGLDEKS